MTETIVALFDDIAVARQVVEDLVHADFPRNSISLITNDANNQYSRYLDKDYVSKDDAVNAAQGAGFGVAIGGLTGLLVGLASLLIPGIGLIIVAGPIAAGLTGLVAGALTGGIVGALVKSGVAEDEAPYYAEGIRRGGTLISVQIHKIDNLRAQDIMNRLGSVNIHQRVNLWRDEGWTGFASELVPIKSVTSEAPPVIQPMTSADLPADSPVAVPVAVPQSVAPMAFVPLTPALIVSDPIAPVIAEPLPVADDTAKSQTPVY